MYVAEAGRGGDHATAESCFDSAEGFAGTGDSGAVTRISKRGEQERVVTGLASFAPGNGSSAIGPHGVFVKGGKLYVTNGGPTAPMRNGQVVLRDPTLVSEDPISALYGTLLKVRKHCRISQIADLWAFENENNPDEEVGNELVDSNPVDVLAGHGGRFYVADAGGNTLLRVVKARSDQRSEPLPKRPDAESGRPDRHERGAHRRRRRARRGALDEPADGLPVPDRRREGVPRRSAQRRVHDLRDRLHDGYGPRLRPRRHALRAVPPGGGTPERIELPAGTLVHPGGIAVGKHGDLYVSNHGTEASAGEVLKINLG